jgi:hypothetical protein
MKILIRWGALFALSVAINEFVALYMLTRYVAVAWAMAALWILFDCIVVATELAQAQAMLKTETQRRNDMQNLYILHADTSSKYDSAWSSKDTSSSTPRSLLGTPCSYTDHPQYNTCFQSKT